MSILNGLLSNSSIKDQILKKFVEDYKRQGITKVMLSIQQDDTIKIDIVEPSKILVDKETHEFLNKFYIHNKPF